MGVVRCRDGCVLRLSVEKYVSVSWKSRKIDRVQTVGLGRTRVRARFSMPVHVSMSEKSYPHPLGIAINRYRQQDENRGVRTRLFRSALYM